MVGKACIDLSMCGDALWQTLCMHSSLASGVRTDHTSDSSCCGGPDRLNSRPCKVDKHAPEACSPSCCPSHPPSNHPPGTRSAYQPSTSQPQLRTQPEHPVCPRCCCSTRTASAALRGRLRFPPRGSWGVPCHPPNLPRSPHHTPTLTPTLLDPLPHMLPCSLCLRAQQVGLYSFRLSNDGRGFNLPAEQLWLGNRLAGVSLLVR